MPELRLNDDQLALAIADVGTRIAWPATPDLRAGVRARTGQPRRIPWWRAFESPRYGFAPAIVTIALALLAVLAFSPEARATATDILRLRGVEIFRGPVPSPSPTRSPGSIQSPTPFPGTGLGAQVSLDEAKARAGFPVIVPTDPLLGTPDQVYLRTLSSGSTAVSFVYLARAGIPTSAQAGVAAIVTEFAGATVDEQFFGKVLDQTTTLQKLTINGQPAFWIQGTPHFFFYNAGGGNIQQETLRLAGNTLIWTKGILLLRLEAQVDLATALRIAGSMR